MIKIFSFCPYFYPAYKAGGPVKSNVNLVNALSNSIWFYIYTRNTDISVNDSFKNIKSDTWLNNKKYEIYYSSGNIFYYINIIKKIRSIDLDMIYLNSFFSFKFSILPLIIIILMNHKAKILLAPRGEFSNGALSIKKFKKKLFIYFSTFIGLHKNLYFQATSNFEKEDILRSLKIKKSQVYIASNIPSSYESHSNEKYIKKENNLNMVFLSRITPIKNLEFLLRTIKKIKLNLSLSIYGPIEDFIYWENCKRIIASLSKNINVSFRGEVHPDKISETICKYDLFVLPTQGENFGHVIYESLTCGVPVLISDKTPWKSEENKVINTLILDQEIWKREIIKWIKMSNKNIDLIKKNIKKYLKNNDLNKKSSIQNLQMFNQIINK